MLTIHEALLLPALKGTKLLAGSQGIDRAIKWVTTIEIIEDISRFQTGEFIVTTGYGLNSNKRYEERLLELIRANRLSGIAFYTGFYIEEIPERFVFEANKRSMPLIEIPKTINFSTITKAIVEQIGNEQMRLLEDSLNIHKEMTKLALSNGGLEEILNKLSPLTDSSLFVFDDLGQLISCHNIHSDLLSCNDKSMTIESETRDINELLQENEFGGKNKTFKWKSFYCFHTPIKAESFTYGYLVAFHKKNVWAEMDNIIMEHVSTLIGIELVKQYAIEETKVRLRGELLEEILMKDQINSEAAIKRGKKLGFNLSAPHQAVFFKVIHHKDELVDSDWSNHLHYIVSQTFSTTGYQHILLPKIDALFALIEIPDEDEQHMKIDGKQFLKNLQERWHYHFRERLIIGIGRLYTSVQQFSLSAKEAEYAVQYSHLLLDESSVIHYDDLGFYQMLIQMKESGISLKQFYESHLNGLINQKHHRTDLILTLETYLTNNCHIQQTAAHLYIHRHTLKYRLSQIEKRTGVNLQSPNERMNLHLAILAYKFIQANEYSNTNVT
ncbi:PucR family transcriptional regulator [Evansella halocellulosilytica]|uniref:PucR family transcriptional regulator n=1 Tax=Evansella halocellulosilytica TaxID=2011013 RepID=UPI0015C889F0|nr:PucR family transcriptional regulator [Evansella halocellulosilytica]